MLKKWMSLLSMLALLVSAFHSLQAAEKKQIKVIVFDFGGVIAKTNTPEVAQFIARSMHISDSEANEAFKQLKEHTNQGKPEPDFWIAYARSRGIHLPDGWQDELKEVKFRATKEIPGMVDLVKDLQRQGYRTALLSNVRQSQAEIKKRLGYYELFDPAIFSYQIGVKKPNPQAYNILLSRLKVPPQQVLFIDNQTQNIEAAKTLGMDAISFVNRDQLVQELKKRGIEVTPSPIKPSFPEVKIEQPKLEARSQPK